MKNACIFLLSLVTFIATAQKSEVLKTLKEYHFDENFLLENLKDSDAQYSFDVNTTNVIGGKTTIQIAKFDATQEVGKRWILLKENGKEPTKKQLRTFDKTHNTKDKVNGTIDDNSWRIEKDTDNEIVITFQYDKKSLPKRFRYLGDCKGLAYFNKKTKKLEKAEYVNLKDIQIKIFKVKKLDLVVYYDYNDEFNTYLISKEDIRMTIKFLGQIMEANDINILSNYKKN
ncbi:hypothetical protein [Flavicella marina]|uniref:hypothetical protein n=1 Tax=Flavicella marina TaxID=1475951 RepID=UPI001264C3CF|nr:hypothetical protein [Flavicella marina]